MIQCKNCGGNVKFDIKSQKMLCNFCDTYYDPYEFEDNAASAEEHDTYESKIFTCPECAGEIISEENEAATFCSFCGASTVLASRIINSKRPNSIIPFKITKDECKEIYKKRMSKALYAPAEVKDEQFIDSFRGIYMPYWVYNATQNKYVNLKAQKHYRSGDYRIEEDYAVDFYLDGDYKGISHDASASFADTISGAIAPYDHSNAVKFSPSFLSGFYADTTDVESEVYLDDIEEICNTTTQKQIETNVHLNGKTIKYPPVNKSELFNTKVSCDEEAMYPVWFVSHRQGDRVTYTTINGVTGKIAADIPIDIKKYLIGSSLVAIPIFILLCVLPTLIPRWTLCISTLLTIIGLITVIVESISIKNKETNAKDKGLRAKVTNNEDNTPKSKNIMAIIFSVCSILMGVMVYITKPVSDVYYYAAVILQLIASINSYIVVIANYNLLSTR